MLAVPKGQQKGNLNDRYDACIQKPAQYLGVKKDAWSAQCPKQLVGVAFVFQIAETGGEHCMMVGIMMTLSRGRVCSRLSHPWVGSFSFALLAVQRIHANCMPNRANMVSPIFLLLIF